MLKTFLLILSLLSIAEAKIPHYEFTPYQKAQFRDSVVPFDIIAASVNTNGRMWSLTEVSVGQVGIGEFNIHMSFNDRGQNIQETCSVLFGTTNMAVKFRKGINNGSISEFEPSVINVDGLQLVIQKKNTRHGNRGQWGGYNNHNPYETQNRNIRQEKPTTNNYSL